MGAPLRLVPPSPLHDLPPRWDGCAVVWRGWETMTVFICRNFRECCAACGSYADPLVNTGLVADEPTMTHEDVRRNDEGLRLAHATGRFRSAPERRVMMRLTAFRCPDCEADTVVDGADGEVWTLDESDYSDAGSVAPT